MVFPLILDPKPSLTKQCLIAAIHLVAAIAFLNADFPVSATIVALLAIIPSGVAWMRAEHTPHAVLEFEDTGAVTMHRRGASLRVRVLPTSVDMGWAIWLQWCEVTSLSGGVPRRSGALMLMPDQCLRGEWRQLRIWLRHKSSETLSDDRVEV